MTGFYECSAHCANQRICNGAKSCRSQDCREPFAPLCPASRSIDHPYQADGEGAGFEFSDLSNHHRGDKNGGPALTGIDSPKSRSLRQLDRRETAFP